MLRFCTDLGYELCIDRSIGKYEFVAPIATGSSCVVVRVRDPKTSETFACKIVSRTDLANRGVILPFEQELRIMESVHHPHLVGALDVIYGEEYIYVIMEECPNGDLLTAVCDDQMRVRLNIRRIFFQVASAVAYLHAKDISHLDIKPDNVLLDKDQNAKLTDFGCCRVRSSMVRFNNVGTLYYSAPEVFEDAIEDSHKCDIWSLGVLLFTISSGKFPWAEGEDEDVIRQIKRVEVIFPADIDPRASGVILRCMAKDPKNRPTISELLADPWFMKADREGGVRMQKTLKQSTTLNGNEYLFRTWKKSVVIVKPRLSGMKSLITKVPSIRVMKTGRGMSSDGEDGSGSRVRKIVSSSQSQQSTDSGIGAGG